MEIVKIHHGFLVPKDTHIGKWQIECQRLWHDEWILPQFVHVIQEGWNVFDLGAFNGDHTYLYHKKVGPKGFVFAVEPGRLAFKCLERNVKYFPVVEGDYLKSYVKCWRAAIAETHGEFYEHIESSNLGGSKVEKCEHALYRDTFLSLTIDDLSALKRPNFVKLSICGYEYKALLGATETLNLYRPIFAIKISRSYLAEQGNFPQQIRDLLHSHKYEIRQFIPDAISWEITPQFDIIAWPK